MPERPDMAAMASRLTRALVAAEEPVLQRHGLTMWAYIVLVSLGPRPSASQGALADAIRADRTRIIPVLDDLQERGLISREPDPADRRVRLVSLTPQGRRLRDAARYDIRRNEDRLLSVLPAEQRALFLQALETLADAAPHTLP